MKNNLLFTYSLSKELKNENFNHKSMVVWFFGLSGSGKSTICNIVEKELFKNNIKTVVLDGDKIREGLNSDLGFSKEDRTENLRRIAEISNILTNNGLVTLCSFITPLNKNRELISSIIGKKNLFWVYVDTPIEICVKRDPKNLYKMANNSKIDNFTGVSSPFEEPDHYEFRTGHKSSPEEVSKLIASKILKKISYDR